jgi:hypothetical protein
MKKKAALSALVLLMSAFSAIPALALTITASGDSGGLCTQTLDVTTSATIVKSGTDCILTFAPSTTTTYNWTKPTSVTSVKVLIVAGGGGGGGFIGAGGGAGGFIETTTSLSSALVAITVGAGGSGGPNSGTRASNGSNSVFSASTVLTAIGGGGGGVWSGSPSGYVGGSGGGGAGAPQAGSNGTANQGTAGGTSYYYGIKDSMATGGGGGAGSAGGNGTAGATVYGGNGGAGKSSNISGTLTYYAGGGGGGTYTGSAGGGGVCGTAAVGGLGGGGNAGTCVPSGATYGNPGNDGAANTGGGGGGGSTYNGSYVSAGGNGGSGIVIIRYTLNLQATINAPTLSGTPYKGATVTISVTTDSVGKVRFMISGKRIANCVSVPTTGSIGSAAATCSWKPAVRGTYRLTATIYPTDTNYQSVTSAVLVTAVGSRSNRR